MHASERWQCDKPEALHQLEQGSELLSQLIEAIRASNLHHDSQIIAMVRDADSFEGLERNLRVFRQSLQGNGPDRVQDCKKNRSGHTVSGNRSSGSSTEAITQD